jgi:hypothetical protein
MRANAEARRACLVSPIAGGTASQVAMMRQRRNLKMYEDPMMVGWPPAPVTA